MKRFTLRAVLLLAFFALAGTATTSCIVHSRGHHRHYVKHRHGKHKKYKKRHHDNGRHRGDRHHH